MYFLTLGKNSLLHFFPVPWGPFKTNYTVQFKPILLVVLKENADTFNQGSFNGTVSQQANNNLFIYLNFLPLGISDSFLKEYINDYSGSVGEYCRYFECPWSH